MDNPAIHLLFLCTNNAVRSIMAESLLRFHGGHAFEVYSGGSDPLGIVNPYAMGLLEEHQYPTADLRSKSWSEFTGVSAPLVDVIITLSDEVAREHQAVRPEWHGKPIIVHWGLPAPIAVEGDEAAKQQAFAQTFQRLQHRIARLIAALVRLLDRPALQQLLDTIGRES